MKNLIAFAQKGTFAGMPANNGIWSWDDGEIIVGYTFGDFVEQKGHNIAKPYRNGLARSTDNGETWTSTEPREWVEMEKDPIPPAEKLNFTDPDLAMRVTGTGYHGKWDNRGAWFYSYDRGHNWNGPCAFSGLHGHPELEGKSFSSRTDYIVEGPEQCLVFLSTQTPGIWGADRVFCARTTDGGCSFHFVSWVVPPSNPYRAVMPATVRCSATRLVSAIRRREMPDDTKNSNDVCWIDTFFSDDNAESWSFLSKVGETGSWNGNPPALIRLKDGRLCCAYGIREDHRRMVVRTSQDEGKSWSDESVFRDDFNADKFNDPCLGYPRIIQRPDGQLMIFYRWATEENFEQHIAGTILDPDEL
jgi:hypothetical protein